MTSTDPYHNDTDKLIADVASMTADDTRALLQRAAPHLRALGVAFEENAHGDLVTVFTVDREPVAATLTRAALGCADCIAQSGSAAAVESDIHASARDLMFVMTLVAAVKFRQPMTTEVANTGARVVGWFLGRLAGSSFDVAAAALIAHGGLVAHAAGTDSRLLDVCAVVLVFNLLRHATHGLNGLVSIMSDAWHLRALLAYPPHHLLALSARLSPVIRAEVFRDPTPEDA